MMRKSIFLSLVTILIMGGCVFAGLDSLRVATANLNEGGSSSTVTCSHDNREYESLGSTHTVNCIDCQENLGEEAHVDENFDMCCDACLESVSALAPSEGEGYVESELTLNETIKISIAANLDEVSEIIVSSWYEDIDDYIYKADAIYNESTKLYEAKIKFKNVNGDDGLYHFDAAIYDASGNMRYVRLSEVEYRKNGISNVIITEASNGNFEISVEAVEGGEVCITTNGEEPTENSTWLAYSLGETYAVENTNEEVEEISVYYRSVAAVSEEITPTTLTVQRMANPKSMITKWNISDERTIKLPISGVGLTGTIDWGDGTVQTISSIFPEHTYTEAGIYSITLTGNCPIWGSTYVEEGITSGHNYYSYTQCLVGVEQWGELNATRYCFAHCENLAYVSNNSTENTFKNVNDMSYMFRGCTSLTSLDVSHFNTSNVTTMKAMFSVCTSLTSLDLNSFDTSKVTDMYSMFYSCTSLTSLDVSSFNTSNVTTMRSMFNQCSKITSLDLSSFDTSNVTRMEYMFQLASKLTSLDLSNFDTSSVTNMEMMFRECRALKNLDISNFDTSNVTTMYGMFEYCSSLNNLNVASFDTSKVKNMEYMFIDCSSLTSLNLNNFNTQNVTSMRSMFNRCRKLTSLDLSNFDTGNVASVHGMFYYATSLKSVLLSNKFVVNTDVDVEAIFGESSAISSIILTDEITTKDQFAPIIDQLTNINFYVPNVAVNNYKKVWTSIDSSKIKPIIEIVDGETVNILKGSIYEEKGCKIAGFEISDSAGYAPIGFALKSIDGTVNTNEAGTYKVTYTVTRTYQNAANETVVDTFTATKTVNICDGAFAEFYENNRKYDGKWTKENIVAIVTPLTKETLGVEVKAGSTDWTSNPSYAAIAKSGDKFVVTFNQTMDGDVYIREIDSDGNAVTYASKAQRVRIDKDVATISNITVATEERELVLRAQINDLESGIASYAVAEADEPARWRKYTKTTGLLETTLENTGTYYLWVKDNVGNVVSSGAIVAIKDYTPPTGLIEIIAKDYVTGSEYPETIVIDGNKVTGEKYTDEAEVEIKIYAEDNETATEDIKFVVYNEEEYKLAKSKEIEIEWQDYTEQIIWRLKDTEGKNIIYVMFKDEAGNTSVVIKGINDVKEANYKIYHYLENPNGIGYLPHSEETRKDITGVSLMISALTKDIESAEYYMASYENGGESIGEDYVVSEDGTTTVYLYYRRHRNVVTLNPDGGIVNPTSVEVIAGGRYGELPTAEKAGYVFDGWYNENDKKIISTTKVEVDKAHELKAKWKNEKYEVTFDANGGQIAEQNVSKTTKEVEFDATYGGQTGLLPEAIRTGYNFAGWFTEKIGGEQITALTIVTTKAKNQILYAQWMPIEYTITYILNDGKVSGNPTKYTIESDDIVLKAPTRSGYDFAGWTGEGITKPTHPVTISAGSIENRKYTANWTRESYKITYELNGGGVAGNPDSYTVETSNITLKNPEKEGYTFTGWTGSNGNEPQTTVVIFKGSTGAKEYQANWNPIEYSITYDLDGGTIPAPGNPTGYNIETTNITLINPTKNGYTFAGWTGTGLATATEKVIIPIGSTGNRTYKASWAAESFDITYNLDGGAIASPGNPTSYTRESNDITLINPTQKGHIFIGWTGTDIATPSKSVKIPKGSLGDREYKANWEIINYTMTYNYVGGSVLVENPATYTVATPTFTLNNPEKTGYDFKGWTGTGLSEKTSTVTITIDSVGNRSYTANWDIKSYPITYELNGGTVAAPGNPTSYQVTTNNILLLNPTKLGYEFLGWLEKDASTKAYITTEPNKTLTLEKGNIGAKCYEATWKRNDYTISYDLAGGTLLSENPTTYNVETATFTLVNPTQEGKTFAGWTGTGLSTATKTVTIKIGSTGNRSYKATWINKPYTITYDLDGGTVAAPGNPTEYTIESAEIVLRNPTKKGASFAGWTGSNGEKPQQEVIINKGSMGNKEYKANWNAHKYTIVYEGNGATEGSMESSKYNYGEEKALTKNAFTKKAYSFVGWNTKQDGTGVSYTDELVVKNLTDVNEKIIVLYAQWKPITYTIVYEPGTEGVTGTTEPSIHEFDKEKKLNKNGYSKVGYTFKYWTSSISGMELAYLDEQSVIALTSEADVTVTMTAQWERNKYTVVYDGNGATEGYMESTTHYYDIAGSLRVNAYKKVGYQFKEWNDKSDGSGKSYNNLQQVSNLTSEANGSVTLYAQWKALEYRVTYIDGVNVLYNLNDISSAQGEYMSYSVNNGVVTVTGNNNDGYGFINARVYLEAGKTYAFTVTTNGTWGSEVEAYLMLDGQYNTYYRMDSTSHVFIPGVTGTYWLRLDVNGAGMTREFRDLKIAAAVKAENETYDKDYGEMPAVFNLGHSLVGWYTEEKGGTEITASSKVKISNDHTLFARWEPIEYTNTVNHKLLYDDGSTFQFASTTFKKVYNTKIIFDSSIGTTLPNGIKLTSFETDDKVMYNYGATAAQSARNMVINAYYTATEYTITYNLNGGANNSLNPSTYTVLEGVEFEDATKSGYDFTKWTDEAGAKITGINIGATSNFTNAADMYNKLASRTACNITVTANFEIVEYGIGYELNGGTVSPANPSKYTVETSTFTLNNPTKTGYTFKGWTGTDLSGQTLNVTIPQGSIGTKWYEANYDVISYTITFNTNGGSEIASITAPYGETITAPANPTKTGYNFKGWDKTIPSKMPAYDMTITASWSEPIVYNITYNLNGGTVSEENPGTYTVETPTFTLNNPEKTGHTFTGWTESSEETPQTSISIAKGTTGNKTYTANWSVNSYTIKFSTISSITAPYGTPITIPENPTKDGYKFVKWNKEIPETMPAYNMTIGATWSLIRYKIEYVLNGGTVSQANPSTYTINTETFSLGNPTKVGENFAGWTGTGLDGLTKTVTIEKGSSGDRKYEANYGVEEYEITYELDGGTVSPENPSKYTIKDEITLNNPTKKGHDFAGWTGTDLSSATETVTIKEKTGDREYKANWTPKLCTYTIIYKSTTGTKLGEGTVSGNFGTKKYINAIDINGYNTPEPSSILVEFDEEEKTIEFIYSPKPATCTVIYKSKSGIELGRYSVSGDFGTSTYVHAESIEHYISPSITTLFVEFKALNFTRTFIYKPRSYNITYNLNGGTVVGNPSTYTIEDEVTLIDPTKSNYTFSGWTGTDLTRETTPVIIPQGSSGNRAYEANYVGRGVKYSVVHKSTNGQILKTEEILREFNTEETIFAEEFVGYDKGTPDNQSVKWDSLKAKEINFTYTPLTYNITVNLAGGTGVADSTYTVESADITLGTPKRTGYTFAGWIGTGLNEPTKKVIITTGSIGDRNYTATWESTVTFDANGGTITNEGTAKVTRKISDGMKFGDMLPNFPTAESTVTAFEGWYTEAGKKVTVNTVFNSTYAGKTLYAEWQSVPTAVYLADGSLRFIKTGASILRVGGTYDGEEILGVYNGFENASYNSVSEVPWYNERKNITSVVFEDIVSPKSTAFWFWGFTEVTSMNLAKLDTKNVTSMNRMFVNCTALENLDLSTFDTSNVTDMNGMFLSSGIKILDISGFDTRNVTDMGDMFAYCESLTTFNGNKALIGDINRDGIVDAEDATALLKHITNQTTDEIADIGDVTGDGVVNVGDATAISKYATGSYTGTIIKSQINFNTSKVTDMYEMFLGCSSLPVLDVLYFDTLNVKSIEYMFGECMSLTSLNLSRFNTSNITDMSNMFMKCSSLEVLDISGFDTSKVIYMNSMFEGCTKLTTFNGNKALMGDIDGDGIVDNEDVTLFAEYIGNGTTDEIADVGDMNGDGRVNGRDSIIVSSYVEGNYSGTDIQAPLNFNTSKVKAMYYMFKGCRSLGVLDLSTFDTSSIIDMGDMFRGCSRLYKVHLGPNFAFVGTDSYLPTPNSSTIIGADGKWHNQHTGIGYAPSDVPNNTNAVYIARSPIAIYSETDNSLTFCVAPGNIKVGDTYNGKVVTKIYTGFEVTEYNVVSETGLKTPWYNERQSIKTVVFDTIIKPISTAFWFYDFINLTSINLTNLDTQNVTSMRSMFNKCSSLKSLDASMLNTSNVENMYCMFYECTSLESVDVSKFNTSKVTTIRSMFSNCIALTSVDVSGFDTSNVTTMAYMFCECLSLTSIDVSGFDTSQVTDMSYMFYKCEKLTTFNNNKALNGDIDRNGIVEREDATALSKHITNKTTDEIADIGDVTGDGAVNIGDATAISKYAAGSYTGTGIKRQLNFNTEKVIDMSCMFAHCYLLKNLDLKGFNTGNVTNMYSMFYRCEALTTLYVDTFNTSKVTNMNGMFSNCKLLTTIDVSNFNTANVTSMEYMFNACNNLTNFNGNKSLMGDIDSDGIVDREDLELLLKHIATDTTSGIANVGDIDGDGEVNISDQVRLSKYIAGTYTGTDIQAPLNFNTEKVTTMKGMFEKCFSLEVLDLVGFSTSSITDMSSMFYECNKLQKVHLGSNFEFKNGEGYLPAPNAEYITGANGKWYNQSTHVGYTRSEVPSKTNAIYEATTEKIAIYSAADNSLTFLETDDFIKVGDTYNGKLVSKIYINFEGETDWAETDVPWHNERASIKSVVFKNTIQPKSTSNWFKDFTSVTSINLTNLDTSETKTMKSMFEGCTVLTTLDVTGLYTEKVTNMQSMFSTCPALKSIDVSNFNTNKVTNMNAMFGGCGALTTLDVSKLDTSNVTNMGAMFGGCKGLTTLDLSNFDTSKVTTMRSMFSGCTALQSVDVSGFVTNNVTSMEYMFSGCANLTKFNVSTALKGDIDGDGIIEQDDVDLIYDYNMGIIEFTAEQLSVADIDGNGDADVAEVNKLYRYSRGSYPLTDLKSALNFNTNNVTSMKGMFQNCSSLKGLDLFSFNTGNVITMASMFTGCSKLQTVYLGENFEFKNGEGYLPAQLSSKITGADGKWYNIVTDVGYVPSKVPSKTKVAYTAVRAKMPIAIYSATDNVLRFYNNSTVYREGGTLSVTGGSVEITKTYTGFEKATYSSSGDVPWKDVKDKVQKIYFNNSNEDIVPLSTAYWFAGFTNLTSISNISRLDTSKVESMKYMFWYCSAITSIDVSGFDTSNVTTMQCMFSRCNALTKLNLSNFDTSNLTTMKSMFYNCFKLEEVQIGTKFGFVGESCYFPTPSSAYINGADGKWYNKSTEVGYIPSAVPDKIAATYVAVAPKRAVAIYSQSDSSLNFYVTSDTIKVGETYNNKAVTKIYTDFESATDWALENIPWYNERASIKKVVFNNTIKPKSTSNWFNGFANATSINLTNLDTSSAQTMRYMFNGCSSLTTLDVSKLVTTNATNIAGMFCNCSALTSLNVSKFNTAKVTEMHYMFSGCSGLTNLDLSNFDTSKVTTMRSMFSNSTALQSIDVSSFNTTNVTSMESMFYDCNSLTSLDVSGFVTTNVTTTRSMFNRCSKLKKIDVSKFNTSKVTEMHYMFYKCHLLETLDLTNFSTGKVTGMTSMFKECNYLIMITLGKNFKFVGTDGYLPAPSSTYITGANGKWYKIGTTTPAYAPASVPTGTKQTYVAVKGMSCTGTGLTCTSAVFCEGATYVNQTCAKTVSIACDNWVDCQYCTDGYPTSCPGGGTCSTCGGGGKCPGTPVRVSQTTSTCGGCGGTWVESEYECPVCGITGSSSGCLTNTAKCDKGHSTTNHSNASCPTCGGTGKTTCAHGASSLHWLACDECDGERGYYGYCSTHKKSGYHTYDVDCSECNGTGTKPVLTACTHGNTSTSDHYYCSTHKYSGSTKSHEYCSHGKTSPH